MITGTGIDIVELKRINGALKRHQAFVQRILTPEEQEIFFRLSENRQVEFLAGRFAVKEAFAKAIGTGIGKRLSWQDVKVLPDKTGKPILISKLNHGTVHISISHSKEYAVANVIIESYE
ncbi:holo-ACP synthase [Anaerobacillus sp. CMMVII]|uniref:holo-ACP synthase n=1 Tax=Anaerobacillus sp. CMMVII TaxID=2755588 RepID=UPI0021B6ECDE|nr:holo-ACP synthase [Anaerobacillus sp. CMMVII]MCT8136564.1 holo-ACP synthase [Anaerobacillus sp. CMMVII]